MPKTTVIFFRDADGQVPVKKWLDDVVATRDGRALIKCKARLKYLRDNGSACRRPYADYLRDGIYELRVQFGGVNYRMLYFFAGQVAAVVTVGLTKESRVPDRDIELAKQRRTIYQSDPERYSHYEQT